MSLNQAGNAGKCGDVRIVPLGGGEIGQAAKLLALSMSANPNHIAIFRGLDETAIHKQRCMFEIALAMKGNRLYAAKLDGNLAGIMGYVDSGHCQLSPLQVIRLLPSMWGAVGGSLPNVLKWRQNWGKHDYKEPHMHFGPLAVDPNHQGKGIGSALLRFFCVEMDRDGHTSYLETDKKENLPLYKRFGFEIVEEDELFGIRNWFMVRRAGAFGEKDS